ncbi:MAG: DUF4625 domain-containing protein [Bacteroidota bacterium]
MKTIRFMLVVTLSAIVFFSSCKKEEEAKAPEFVKFELGYDNSGIAVIGADLHIDAEIFAEGKIADIMIEIHLEGDHEIKSGLDTEWEFDSTYTIGYAGVKNVDFHEHIDIPASAEAGDYHFHLIVTDMEGNRSEKEAELKLIIPTDTNAPVVTVSISPSNGQVFNNGSTITISGNITDDVALGGAYIGLAGVAQNLEDPEVNATNTITLLHTHEFVNTGSFDFNASIIVGAMQDNNVPQKPITGDIAWQSGSYYLLIKSVDVFGGNWGFSQRFPIVINY